MDVSDQVIIIGAGLAGLCCALTLSKQGIPFVVLEASDAVGGRVRTDIVDGFRLNRGFQIFLTAYPEAAKVLDYNALELKRFFPGAKIRTSGAFHHLVDPFREPVHALETLVAPVGTIMDKLRVAALRNGLSSDSKIDAGLHEQTTLAALKNRGFSESMIQQFFRPFFGGIFLEQNLESNAALFEFIFAMLSKGDNTIPSSGMQAIPEQIASKLPKDSIRLNCSVSSVNGREVSLVSGESIKGSAVVIATEEPQTNRLLGRQSSSRFRSQTCVYFAANKAPFEEPILVLNGEDRGVVSNLVVPSNVAPSYSSDGRALINAVVIGDAAMSDFVLEEAIRSQMTEWYGSQVLQWSHLKTYRIKYALPDQSPAACSDLRRTYKLDQRVYCCGDFMETASINGAMLSGRKAAEAVLADTKALSCSGN